MRIFDCFMFYDEEVVLDIRLNSLKNSVDCFVVVESKFYHNGKKRDLKFDINKYPKFKEKIIYIPLTKQPDNIKIVGKTDNLLKKNSKILDNALSRENFQRNFLQSSFDKFDDNDLIIISDLDEIPNLEKFIYKKKITFFEQKMFYYKLNLIHKNFLWYGSKISKKKHLISPQWLRNIKSKKYPLWRIDILLSKTKYNDIDFIKNGGWHFTNVKSAEEIDYKMKNFLHHLEYEESGLGVDDVKKIISDKKVFYDHKADKTEKKWNAAVQLEKENDSNLPEYIISNKLKFKEWLD